MTQQPIGRPRKPPSRPPQCRLSSNASIEWVRAKEASCTRGHALQIKNSLHKYAAPLLAKPVNKIETPDVLAVLQPCWFDHPSASRRIQNRIEAVLDFSRLKGHRTGENPARWKAHLQYALPRRTKALEHFKALPYEQVPDFCRYLRGLNTTAALAVEFQILTAVRPSEAEARWSEIDCNIWTIPAERTKRRKPLRIPLVLLSYEI